MRAIGIKSFGGPEVVGVIALPEPTPGPGEVRVRVAFAGVGEIDAHVRRGSFAGREAASFPLVLGYEGAGEVDAVGPGVDGLTPGDRVAWCGVAGSQAEQCLVPAWRTVKVPQAMPLDVACALQLAGATAHALTVSAFPVRAGDWLLVRPDHDDVGHLLVQIAKAQGARVVVAVRREVDAAAPRAAGADTVVVSSSEEEVVAAARAATGGQGCNAVFDSVGRETIASSIACCRRRGVVALFGASSGAVEAVSPDELAAAGSIFLTRVHLPDYMQDAAEVQWRAGDVASAWASGSLRFEVGRILPLEGAREAHVALDAGTPTGKIVLKTGL
jgi:NADPH2:quinone reductase